MIACLLWSAAARADPVDPGASYTLRAKLAQGSAGGVSGDRKLTLVGAGARIGPAALDGADWSGGLDLTPIARAAARLKVGGAPVVAHMTIAGAFPADWATNATVTTLEARVEVLGPNGRSWTLRESLFGPDLGILFWKDPGGAIQVGTMADYNRRYWKALAPRRRAPVSPPGHIVIADRFIGGDDDAINWREGFAALRAAGMNTLLVPPLRGLRRPLADAGIAKIGWAVSAPEDKMRYIAPDDAQTLSRWAGAQGASYARAGFGAHDMAIFALADEPGWYYPAMLRLIESSPAALPRFQTYLQDQHLGLADIGASSWADVRPIGRGAVHDLPSRRLFYWSMRFAPADSARYFAEATASLENAFYPGLPLFVNWNNFSGRLYVPGPIANNPDKTNPDAGMGLQDWFEFGRARGATMLWTEDWFGDAMAREWSFHATRLMSASGQPSGPDPREDFGGYIVPRVELHGATPDGIAQKVMALVGHGGKAVQYFWFGPDYNFPGNCYSDTPGALAAVQRANAMVAAADDLLWPGRPQPSPVAILAPRSSELWDAPGERLPTSIEDATNTNPNLRASDYTAEVADLFFALQDANIPVEFVSEDDLTARGLAPYRVLYVTEPDVPVEGQRAIAAWTEGGGTLVTVRGAATRDRYDQTTDGASGPSRGAIVADLQALKTGPVTGPSGGFDAVEPDPRGSQGPNAAAEGLATFSDGSPAIEREHVGRGTRVHFAFMPGLSYARLLFAPKRPPEAKLAVVRDWIADPVHGAGVVPPVTVSTPGVETPVLLSSKGAAVTLLNWTGAPVQHLGLTIRLPFRASRVESVARGRVTFHQLADGIALDLPLNAVDVLMIRRAGLEPIDVSHN